MSASHMRSLFSLLRAHCIMRSLDVSGSVSLEHAFSRGVEGICVR